MATPFARFVPDPGACVSTSSRVCRSPALGVLPTHLDLTAAAFHAAPAPAAVLAGVVEKPAATAWILTDLNAPWIARRKQLDRGACHRPEQVIETLLIRPPVPPEALILQHQGRPGHRLCI